MKNVNQLVLDVQAEGNESYSYVLLFQTIMDSTINPKAESFRKQLKGQVDEAIAEGVDLLMELVPKWDGTGNFHSLFKTAYNNRLLNLVKYMNRNKRKQDVNYDVSLSEMSNADSGEASPVLEVASDIKLQNHVDFDNNVESKITLEEMLEKFAEENPEKYDLIEIKMNFHEDMKQAEKSNAYCVYYGVQSYTPIQKKVSRATEAFYAFLKKNNYALNF